MAHTKVTKNGTQNNGTANTFSYSGSFDVFKASEVEVELDNVALTFTTSTINESASPREYTVDYDNKTVHIGGANLASSNSVVIQPVTDMGAPTPRATYAPGSSVTSEDLNNNQLQLMRKAMEYDEQKLSSRGGTMTGNLHFGKNVDLSFEGSSDNTYETTLTVADPTSDKTITFPDTTGTVVTTGDTGTVATGMIAADAVTGAKIADDQINSEHYVDGSIDTAHIGNAQVTADKLGNDSVITAKIQNSAVTTVKIADDAVTADKLAHTSVTAGTYTATDLTVDAQGRITAASSGTIAGSEIAADAIDGTKIADDSINSEHYVDGSIDTAHIAVGQITSALMAANSVNTDAYVDNSIEHVHLKNDIIDGDNIQDDVINSEHIAAGAVDLEHMSANSVDSDQYVDGSIDRVHLEADIIDGTKLADDAVDSEHIAADSLDTEHYAPTSIDSAALASNAVTETKITDANVTEVKLAANSVTISKIGCEQTTISDSDSHIPTSGAVVDYVAAQIAPIGGLEVIADEDNFPTSQPSSGVVISISDAAGIVVNGSGVSTTARTVGNGSDNVTINNFPSSLYNETLASGVGLMVSSTGSSNTYNYHKLLAAETDVKQLSDDINDFQSRYRVGASNPTSSLDSGDLFFNTGSGKLLVYNGTQSAWEEAQSIGQYFINTISSYSGTGGNSASFNGAAYRFVLSNAGSVAEQHIVSINGVIQKPNSGTSQPSEGFAIDGSSIIFSSAPATGSDFFIITIGSTVNIGTPSDGTVTASKLTSGAVETAKIADGAVIQAKVGDQAINEAKLQVSNAPTNGYFLSAQSGNTGGLTWAAVNTDLSNDSSPQLGGQLQSNGQHINLEDNDKLKLGTNGDTELYHNNTDCKIENHTGDLYITNIGSNSDDIIIQSKDNLNIQVQSNENSIVCYGDGAVELYHDNSKTAWTTGTGFNIKGGNTGGNSELQIYGNEGRDAEILLAADDGDDNADYWKIISSNDNSFYLQNYTAGSYETNIKATGNAGVELYHDNSKKFETTTAGVNLPSANAELAFMGSGTCDHSIQSPSGTNDVVITANKDAENVTANIVFKSSGSGGGTVSEKCRIDGSGHFRPGANNTFDLGTSSLRWRNVYTNDLHLSNEGHTNSVDGTWGDWTIQEGESDLFLKNNRSGKKYKFNLTEVS